ncbi:hypothetical protein BGZ65_010755 [Modicella reniformis]|uniref:C2 domain-containing protein n=1 Tax=Modicella reniformis TaxID=1440133 RepID=A0A9P6SNR7_9FUNG|nr:hypothetical protein BGZ65_010755 [Modicella reniformis]
MLDSLYEKISNVVNHHHKKHPNTNIVPDVIDSDNRDYIIVFKGAKDVPVGDILTSDPYLAAYLGPVEDPQTLSYITGVHWNTLNPVWEAQWDLLNVPDDTVLHIYVKDKNRMKEDTPLGKATLILGARLDVDRLLELPITKEDGNIKGCVIIEIKASKTRHGSLIKASTKGPVRFSRHTSYAAGVLTGEAKYEFHAYRIRLYHLIDVFGADPEQYQHWNRNYESAKRIFAENLEGQRIRSALHSQHSYLYRHRRNTLYGSLSTGKDLGDLLHGERLKKDPKYELTTVVFTYSIIPKGLYFSETGVAFFQDFMSKHAMHANRAAEVIFAGEFRLFRHKSNDDKWTLFIDNNSGTYGPKKEDLPKIKKIFELNFSDLTVVALDHDDDHLKEIRAATKELEAAMASQQKQRFALFSSMRHVPEDAHMVLK